MDGYGGDAANHNKPTELELLRMRMNVTTDESLAATKRILTHADQAQKTGAATMEQLAAQGEQLRRIDQDMDHIHSDMREADQNLEALEKCCGLCFCPCKRRYKAPQVRTYYDRNPGGVAKKPAAGARTGNARPAQPVTNQPTIPGEGQYIQRIMNDSREDEMEDNLRQTGAIVSNLHTMATEMNQEIRTHNEILGRVDQKADANKTRIDIAQSRAEHILGRPARTESSDPKATIGMAAAKYMMK